MLSGLSYLTMAIIYIIQVSKGLPLDTPELVAVSVTASTLYWFDKDNRDDIMAVVKERVLSKTPETPKETRSLEETLSKIDKIGTE